MVAAPNGWALCPGSRAVGSTAGAWSLCVLGRVIGGIGWAPDAGLTGPGRAVTLVGDACPPCRTRRDCPCGAAAVREVQHARPGGGAARRAGHPCPVRPSSHPRVRADPGPVSYTHL